MSTLTPTATTVDDLCKEALKEAGVVGVGQTAKAEDIVDTWTRLQWMLQQWQVKRFMVYHLITIVWTSTGAQSYTIGPGGSFNADFNADFSTSATGGILANRPDKIESAFARQLNAPGGIPVDFPLELLQSFEDYNRIALKGLTSFPGAVFYDPSWPLGTLYLYPIPQASIYAIGITIKEQLPVSFPSLAAKLVLPFEYYNLILYSLAWRLRSRYQIPTFQGDPLPGLVKDAEAAVRGANTALARLQMPNSLTRPGLYNIFSDRSY